MPGAGAVAGSRSSPISCPAAPAYSILGTTARTAAGPSFAAARSASSKVTRTGRKFGELAFAIFWAVATERADNPSSALAIRAAETGSTSFLPSLTDDFGVERAGRLDRLQDADQPARIDLRARPPFDPVG